MLCHNNKIISNSAITLIALIITIIIMLILATVVLNLTIGKRGILNTAEESKIKTEYTSAKEIIKLKLMEIESDCRIRNAEYNIVEIAKSMKEDDKITIEKYYNSNVALVKDGVNENLVSLKGILVSANSYSKYKFLIGAGEEGCKIERVTTKDITDTTSLEEDIKDTFEHIDDYEAKLGIDIGPRENRNIFKELENNSKTVADFPEYGMAVSRSGSNQFDGCNELYSLGMGSERGTNHNVFTLTIDYETLCSKLDTKIYKGIYAEFNHSGWTYRSSLTSWVYSKILVKYDDDTEKEIQTEMLSACNTEIKAEPSLTLMFEPNKKVSEIQIIIDMYDSDCGNAQGTIRNIELIR